MTHYYDILGLQPGASKAEIKEAYRRLCQECHPDKLPPDTPKKARQIVEEHFKQINEAYAYLMEHNDSPPPVSPVTDVSHSRPVFDPARMEAIARQLEMRRHAIQQEYQQAIKAIDKQQRQKLAYHGLRVEDLGTVDPATKWGNVIQGGILLLFGLLVGSIGGLLGFLGYFWAFFCFWATLGAMLTKTVSPRKYKIICEVKTETEAAKLNASQKKEQELQELSSYIRRRTDYFKTLPLEMLSESFVQQLSDEDQFFLLLAIKEREDAKQWARTVETGVEIAAAAGVVLLLSQLFFGGPF